MTTRTFGWIAGGLGGLVLASAATLAQMPPEPMFPPLVIDDPAVEPAQFTRPTTLPNVPPGDLRPPARLEPARPETKPVADPPAPVVRIQVRVPADAPPGDDLAYTIVVHNTSQADAHQVTVRNPIPEGVAGVVKVEPKTDDKHTTAIQLGWSFGTLKAGEKRTIELVLKPKPNATEVKNLAYVRFEHGEAVTTKINRPAVKVTKAAPKQGVKDEPYLVRVLVENTGRVPAEKVRVVENVDRAAEVEAITAGSKRTRPDDNQWQWDVGTLLPGQRKVIEYRVTPRLAKADPAESVSIATTHVDASKDVLEKAEARTQVLFAKLDVDLKGPAGVVNPGEAAEYEIVVRNNGTLPSTAVRITGTIPADCRPTSKTGDGHVYRDSIVWAVPKLEPKEAYSVRYRLKANTTGARTVVASVTDARKVRDSREVRTLFQGTAALSWETIPDATPLAVGQQGVFTVKVKNGGGEDARNVRVEVDLPDSVEFVQATPAVRAAGGKVTFGADTIAAYKEATYTITYKARRSAQARFQAKLTADALGDRPLSSDKVVEITGAAK